MPIFPPRSEPVKKKQQLDQKARELYIAITKEGAIEKINKQVEKYRLAKLSMIKELIHSFHEKGFQKKVTTLNIQKLEQEMVEWKTKPTSAIIAEIKKTKFS